jgi:hypothetical protein
MKISVFWDVTQGSLVGVYRRFGGRCWIDPQDQRVNVRPCRWKQYVPPKSRYTSTRLRGVASQKSAMQEMFTECYPEADEFMSTLSLP